MAMSEPIRDKAKLRQLAGYFLKRRQFRNHALIVLGVHTALRISDLLRLAWPDVYDERAGVFHTHLTVTERKTGKHKTIALNRQAIAALRLLLPHRRGVYIFTNNRKDPAPISRVQAWRIVRAAADAVSLSGRIACHSLRKTFGYHAWIAGTSPVVLMDIYNHSSYEVTRRYLGVSQDDRDKVYMALSLF
jgi:integrase